jgi:uncharacterized membrane protein
MSQPNPQPAAKNDQTFWIYLSYLCGWWILGLIALSVVKDDERVRFQCAQAVILTAAVTVAWIVLGIFSWAFWFLWPIHMFFQVIIWLLLIAYYVYAVVFVVLQIAQNGNPRVPVAGDFAEKNLMKLFK